MRPVLGLSFHIRVENHLDSYRARKWLISLINVLAFGLNESSKYALSNEVWQLALLQEMTEICSKM